MPTPGLPQAPTINPRGGQGALQEAGVPDANIRKPGAGAPGAGTGIRTPGLAGGAGKVPSTFTPDTIVVPKLSELRADIPQGTAIPKQMAAYDAMLEKLQKQKEALPWNALTQMGATMAATPGPIGRSMGTGISAGLADYNKNMAVNQQQQLEGMGEQGRMGIAQDRQTQMNEEIARKQQMDLIKMQQDNAVNKLQSWHAALQSQDANKRLGVEVQIANIHAAAQHAANTDYRMQKLVQDTQYRAQQDFAKIAALPKNQAKYMHDPDAYYTDEKAHVAAMLSGIPNLNKYYVQDPSAGAGGGTRILQDIPQAGAVRER
jgi:hypothetical protein